MPRGIAFSYCNLLVAFMCRCAGRMTALALVSIALTGCGPRTVPASDVEQATALITQTFNDWKAGATLDAQRTESPPVYVAEELWLKGVKLKDYELTGPGETFGTNVRFHVKLKCIDQQGAAKDHNVKYLVTTTPERTIAREDR